jgi:hypothetical protein
LAAVVAVLLAFYIFVAALIADGLAVLLIGLPSTSCGGRPSGLWHSAS